ncbi:1,2-phenylacetyl-CoA epoxidase subunit PaaC [Natrarchaeobius chitinivorans]|uniref:Phenylacetate-CoA oxygenase subunit PaaI n=1 Tax=Natrarchaeobius chitinivorans TaxID=1679083 RepID=A0A3N6MSS2_NATCH|nr:1,2-phenylacetyl-CoA epoxidase subunit PaaC [Natrarchaeobius chitinivorans]RQG97816.1 phenylacetate-CoA oxygenase subunit PaaI [Natrarchaeobius chitinivorans]
MSSPLENPTDFSARERRALETLVKRLGDDEFVLAERYTEWQVRAPSLESDLALANNAQDELGHARLWYDVLADLDVDERDLVYERDPADFRHSTLVELPFAEGDWADAVLRSYLYDAAEDLRLEALEDSAYPPIADRVGKIRSEEEYHLEHARNWLERLAEGEEGRDRLQDALDRLFPHALTLFESATPPVETAIPTREASGSNEIERNTDETSGDRSDADAAAAVEGDIVDFGLRTATLEELGEEWLSIVVPFLESLDLDVPIDESTIGEGVEYAVTVESLPTQLGRDGTHTDAWFDLYDDLTHTYRELERSDAAKIREDPDR